MLEKIHSGYGPVTLDLQPGTYTVLAHWYFGERLFKTKGV